MEILDIEKNQGILLPENRDVGYHKVRMGYWDIGLLKLGQWDHLKGRCVIK